MRSSVCTPACTPARTVCRCAASLRAAQALCLGLICLLPTGISCRSPAASVQRALDAVAMGAPCHVVAVGSADRVDAALQAASRRLAELESELSTYRDDSQLSRFNTAGAGQSVPLTGAAVEVLRAARRISEQTDGAFDISMAPLTELWRQAQLRGEPPGDDELAAARELVGNHQYQVDVSSAKKLARGVRLTVDAIAKGYAVHAAAEAMRPFGLQGALVEVGGDIECWGAPLDAPHWRLGVQSPWSDTRQLAVVSTAQAVRDASKGIERSVAVCTSGNYRRFVTVGSRRHSHIIDPRTGLPCDVWPSVTVVAADATTADAWATALSVLGPDEGLPRLPPDVDALWIGGTPEAPLLRKSAGFTLAE